MELGDNQGAPPSDERLLSFARMILVSAAGNGSVVVEQSVCPKCKGKNLYAHCFTEWVVCQHVQCEHRYPSTVARLPQPGEANAGHYEAAIATVHSAARQKWQDNLPIITQEEYDKFTPAEKILYERIKMTITLRTCEKLAALTEEYAVRNIQ